ncbi:MAG: plasmid recombination protein [Colwellia sp.]|nr:plasmid recombination protein [Colwellia sp.]
MSGYQFFHIETYARTPSRTGKKQSILGLVREAERHPNACLHIEKPQKPTLLYGNWPSEAANALLKMAEQAKDSKARRLRKDAQILLAGVASYPIPSNQVDIDCPKLKIWLHLNLNFLKAEYGNALKSVIIHLEESHPHIHFYCHPELNDENRLNIRDIHGGMKLRDSVPDKGVGSGKLRSRLYKQAMRDQQDRYHQVVGLECGLARIGPKTRKLSRKEWMYEQQNAKRQQKLLEAEKVNKQVLSQIEQAKSKNLELVYKNQKLLNRLEKENIVKASFGNGFFNIGKRKFNYLKGKLNKSVLREGWLKEKYCAEQEKVKKLDKAKKLMSSQQCKQEEKIKALEVKVNKLVVKIESLVGAVKSWKKKYYQLIASLNSKGESPKINNNKYESSYDG